MPDLAHSLARGGGLLLACATLAACAPKTTVSASGNVPSQYTHFFVTAKELWFNTSATASPADSGWAKFTLSAPVTVDLATATGNTLAQITSGLKVATGTYAQIRLIPLDETSTLAASAESAGAVYNSEIDYVDTSGTTHQLPLELQNVAEGIGIPTSFTVNSSTSGLDANLGASSTSTGLTGTTTSTTSGVETSGGLTTSPLTTTTATNGATSAVGTTTSSESGLGLFGTGATTTTGTTTTGTTTTGTTTTDTGTSTATVSEFSLVLSVDGSTDLAPFTYGNSLLQVLLNPHFTAHGASTVGAVQGTVTLATTGTTSTTTSSGIEVTAESLSADGTRHVPVASTQVNTDGSFVLYPLPTSSSSPASYDLVVHGPGIATIVVQSVRVNVGNVTTSTPVSIGALAPRSASTFNVNIAPGSTPVQAGALIGFYQTIPGGAPYLIEQRPIDAFNRKFALNQQISAGTIDYGTYAAGSNVTLTTVTPSEGEATYRVSASAPSFADGTLTTLVRGTAAAATSSLVSIVTVPALSVASGAVPASLAATVTATPGHYNQGYLIVSRDGGVVQTVSIASALTQGSGTVTLSGLPGGTSTSPFAAGVYYLSVRVWNSSNPSGTLSRQDYSLPADLSAGNVSGYAATVD